MSYSESAESEYVEVDDQGVPIDPGAADQTPPPGDEDGGSEGENNTPAALSPEQEADRERARRMGWSPLDEFRGGADRWVNYDVFLKKGDETLPIMRERLRKSDRAIAKLEGELHNVIRTQGKFERDTYSRVSNELEVRAAAAVEAADTDAYEQIRKERAELVQPAPEPAPPAPGEAKTNAEPDPEFDTWAQSNPWYGADTDLTAYADSMGGYVSRTRPELVGTPQFYGEVKNLVAKQYPTRFSNSNRSRGPDVSSARGPSGADTSRTATFASLPPEAREKAAQYIANGWIKDEAEYLESYNEAATVGGG